MCGSFCIFIHLFDFVRMYRSCCHVLVCFAFLVEVVDFALGAGRFIDSLELVFWLL